MRGKFGRWIFAWCLPLLLLQSRIAWAGGSAGVPRLGQAGFAALLAQADLDEPTVPTLKRPERQQVKRAKLLREDDTPAWKTWWFWTLTGALVVGTVVFGAVVIKSSEQPPRPCNPGVLACFGDGRQ